MFQYFFQKIKVLETVTTEAETAAEGHTQANLYASKVLPAMLELRSFLDQIEEVVPDQHWPLPKYQEMLFIK